VIAKFAENDALKRERRMHRHAGDPQMYLYQRPDNNDSNCHGGFHIVGDGDLFVPEDVENQDDAYLCDPFFRSGTSADSSYAASSIVKHDQHQQRPGASTTSVVYTHNPYEVPCFVQQ
jgi:hypothetical protein